MGDFFRSVKFKILISVLVILLAFMLRAAWTGGLSPLLTQVAGVISTPFQQVSSTIAFSVRDFFQRYAQADEIAAENARLREELNALRNQMIDYEQYKQENSTLKEYLDIKEQNPDFELEPAAVIARDPNSRFYSFTIDKGSLAGVKVHDTVISEDGLVGRISEVGLNFSKVLTILDPQVDVGAYDVRTRDSGLIRGTVELAAQGNCKLTYLLRESGVRVDDLVVTTGGSLYPKGLIIGRISEVGDEAGGLSRFAVIEPAADIRVLQDVMVIKSYLGQENRDE